MRLLSDMKNVSCFDLKLSYISQCSKKLLLKRLPNSTSPSTKNTDISSAYLRDELRVSFEAV
jgi:hypothetical protein